MALIKKHVEQEIKELPTFTNIEDAKYFFETSTDFDEKVYVIEEIIKFHGGGEYLIEYINNEDADKKLSTKVASVISNMDSNEAPIEKIMDLLRLENAYVRNLGISMLRDFGDSIRYYIIKFLIGDDKDLRIFAINVLGDVNFSESRDMLVELLETEQEINVAMTAVDYMAEIGEEEDIPLLESLKERFAGEFYVQFAVDGAVKMIKG
ncbi:HEAT repeat domain-containing protein [Sulfurimonas aquatica]|uniref:HEAT repeat domain-containing protein n=1 Tax=Sulfurimonas aquatica TaxID=2672570 RepID=A0A975GD24_9BACT|nr:HEAT repeat domain-containing protein [Sulfurimonas aquatica]QSZ42291.1 HEAT repeat domain-containing protein [Sulfurimonas aquatica]